MYLITYMYLHPVSRYVKQRSVHGASLDLFGFHGCILRLFLFVHNVTSGPRGIEEWSSLAVTVTTATLKILDVPRHRKFEECRLLSTYIVVCSSRAGTTMSR